MQGLLLVSAVAWLALCTWMFHGMLEVQLTVSGADEALEAPTERDCSGLWLFKGWCERRVDALRAEAVREGMQHAWAGYKAFAWGADEIHPKSKTAKTDIMVGGWPRGICVQNTCAGPGRHAGCPAAVQQVAAISPCSHYLQMRWCFESHRVALLHVHSAINPPARVPGCRAAQASRAWASAWWMRCPP